MFRLTSGSVFAGMQPLWQHDAGAGAPAADPSGAGEDSTSSNDGAAEVPFGPLQTQPEASPADGQPVDDAERPEPDDNPDDLIADSGDDAASPAEERIKRLVAKGKKDRRALTKAQKVRSILGDEDPRALVRDAGQMRQMREAVQRGDQATIRAVLGITEQPAASPDADQPSTRLPAFDRSKLPFKAEQNEIHGWFADEAERNHDLRAQFNTIVGDVDARLSALETHNRTGAQKASSKQWDEAIDAAAKTIADTKTRDGFEQLVRREGNMLRAKGQNFEPTKVCQYWLARLGLKPSEVTRATAAAKSRSATHNKALPQHMGGGGAPASSKSTKTLSLREINRNIQRTGRAGG